MSILLGFLPFLVFAVLSVSQGALVALLAGAAVSAGLMIRSRLRGGSAKTLEAGTFVVFMALAAFASGAGQTLSVIAIRLCADSGLLAIVLISMAVRRPFTMQYAKEQVPQIYWTSPGFIRTNYAISAAWAVAFLVMVLAEAAMLEFAGLSKALGTAVIIAALLGGVAFTQWRAQAGHAAA